jgi:hypothetical protein
MKVEVTQKANLYIFKNYSFRCVEEEYDTDIHPDESIAKDIFEEKMLSQLQKEANFAIIHECKIRNTSLPEAIKIVIDYKKL